MKDLQHLSESIKDDFIQNGYAIVDLLRDEDIDYCLECFKETEELLHLNAETKRYNSLEIHDYQYRRKVYELLSPYLQDKIEKYVKQYQILGINFAIKKSLGNEFEPHIDDSHTDIDRVGINIWIPLSDVTQENGSLYLFKGTQNIHIPMRGIGLPFPYLKFNDLIKKNARPLTLKKGQAIIFNDKILHGSGRNLTPEQRNAIIVGMIPKDAQPKVYVRYEELGHGKAELFDAPSEFFFKFNFHKRPEDFHSYGIFNYTPPSFDEIEFKNLISPSS